jgi:hypothetical protein
VEGPCVFIGPAYRVGRTLLSAAFDLRLLSLTPASSASQKRSSRHPGAKRRISALCPIGAPPCNHTWDRSRRCQQRSPRCGGGPRTPTGNLNHKQQWVPHSSALFAEEWDARTPAQGGHSCHAFDLRLLSLTPTRSAPRQEVAVILERSEGSMHSASTASQIGAPLSFWLPSRSVSDVIELQG